MIVRFWSSWWLRSSFLAQFRSCCFWLSLFLVLKRLFLLSSSSLRWMASGLFLIAGGKRSRLWLRKKCALTNCPRWQKYPFQDIFQVSLQSIRWRWNCFSSRKTSSELFQCECLLQLASRASLLFFVWLAILVFFLLSKRCQCIVWLVFLLSRQSWRQCCLVVDCFLVCLFRVFFCKVRIVAVQPWNFFLIRDVVCFDYSSRLRSAYFDSLIVRIICEFVQAPVGEVQTEFHWVCVHELQNCCSLLFRYSSWFSRILFPLKDPQSELIELLDYFFDFWSVKV